MKTCRIKKGNADLLALRDAVATAGGFCEQRHSIRALRHIAHKILQNQDGRFPQNPIQVGGRKNALCCGPLRNG